MRIAIVAPMDARTGISNYSETLSIELIRLGEDVTVVAPENSQNSVLLNMGMNYVEPENYEVDDYDLTHFQLACSPLHEYQLHIINKHRKKLLNNMNVVTTVHDARNFDLFNIKCSKCISFGINLPKYPFYPHDVVDKGFHSISNRLIFHSNSAMNEYKSRYYLNSNTLRRVLHPAYSIPGVNTVYDPVNETEEIRFLAPGYISPFKGHDILINAVSKINQDFKLIFMGKILDENYGEYLKKLVKKEGLNDKVEFLGFVTEEEFIKQINRAKIILIPRLTSSWLNNQPVFKLRKIFGLHYLINQSTSGVLTKALASGKPVICSKSQGFSDYIDESRGIMCDDDVESWRNAINYMLLNPNNVTEMSLNSSKFAVNELSPTNIAKQHLKIYKEHG